MTIEPLVEADAQSLGAVALLAIIGWGGIPTPEGLEARKSKIQAELDALDLATTGVLVVREAGLIVGIGRVRQMAEKPDVWMLYGLVVHPAYRRRGIGRALVRARIAYARERGARCIVSQTHADNEPSIAFHMALGFVEDHRFTAPDGDKIVAFRLLSAGTSC